MKKNAFMVNKSSVLCISRTYPPQIGGMERLSFNVIFGLSKFFKIKTIVNTKGKKNFLPFIIWAIIRALILAPQVNYVHFGDATLAFIGYLMKKIYNRPTIYNVHGLDLIYNNSFYKWYLKKFFKPDKLICNSKNTEKIARRLGYECTVVITPGIEVNKFKSTPTGKAYDLFKENGIVPSQDKILLTVGRLIQRKGIVWFCENVIPVLSDNIKYLIVGDGPERSKVEKIIEINKLKHRIFLLGMTNQEVLDQLYQSSDLFVMPNIIVDNDVEGFGFVALEASAWGLPVVTSGIEGIADAVKDGQNGFIVEVNNSIAFKNKIKELLYNKKNSEILSKQVRQYTFEKYNWESIIQLYKEEILSTKIS